MCSVHTSSSQTTHRLREPSACSTSRSHTPQHSLTNLALLKIGRLRLSLPLPLLPGRELVLLRAAADCDMAAACGCGCGCGCDVVSQRTHWTKAMELALLAVLLFCNVE